MNHKNFSPLSFYTFKRWKSIATFKKGQAMWGTWRVHLNSTKTWMCHDVAHHLRDWSSTNQWKLKVRIPKLQIWWVGPGRGPTQEGEKIWPKHWSLKKRCHLRNWSIFPRFCFLVTASSDGRFLGNVVGITSGIGNISLELTVTSEDQQIRFHTIKR